MRPRILTFVDYYLPGFKAGGPLRTIANLVDRLGDEVEFLIVTRDRDLGDTVRYAGVETGRWSRLGKAAIFYAPPSQLTLTGLGRLMRSVDHDQLYLNSLFSPRMTIQPLAAVRLGLAPARRTIIAPRGELGAGALGLKSLRKSVYLRSARLAGLYGRSTWQASSAIEAADITAAFGKGVSIVVAPNLPAAAPAASSHREGARKEALKVVFLGRVSPMKNLDFALAALRRVRVPVEFTLFGPKEHKRYWQECEAQIALLPPNVRFIDGGPLKPQLVPETLARFDLLFLPSRGENYGQVIAEALQAGLPVLISDKTPWRGLAAKGVGSDVSLDDLDGFVAALERQQAMDAETRLAQRARVLKFAEELTMAGEALVAHRRLFGLATDTDSASNSDLPAARTAST